MITVNLGTFDSTQKWKALDLWIFKPTAYNKTIGTANFICANDDQTPKPLNTIELFFGDNSSKITCYSEVAKSISDQFSREGIKFDETLDFDRLRTGCWTILRLSVPKNGIFKRNTIHVISCDSRNGIFKFAALNSIGDGNFTDLYSLRFDDGTVTFQPSVDNHPEVSRIGELFKLKFEKWLHDGVKNSGPGSLALVPIEEYIILYNQLKKKYGESIKEIWTESTDPDKFIHEDIAIATYLILLWQRRTQKFVDLGCGNGLLVHILNSEGHQGHGIDVRPRKIWDCYPPSTILKVETIVPTLDYVFPNLDWIIGNHSDELSPWIPVISALSSERTNFFLLPCCAYEFSGVKFKRTDSSKSVYMGYLDYLESICRTLGFDFGRDRLKIPSTKRICIVSKGRNFPCPSAQNVREIINERCRTNEANHENMSDLAVNFKPRESTEKVRNCTQLNRPFVISLIAKISNLLLTDAPDTDLWKQGTPINLSSLAEKLTKEDLRQLKSECGGLQTFLRNHRYIFQIVNGEVNFIRPVVKDSRPLKWKTKPCWFFANHPQSCPLSDKECYFLHLGSR